MIKFENTMKLYYLFSGHWKKLQILEKAIFTQKKYKTNWVNTK